MNEMGNTYDKPHKKCARIVGDTMGKYHPHGDSSIYGALVNMAQNWSMRYTLVDGHGNFGSVDGDGAAAMRYTEARLSKIASYMIDDLNKDTVDFMPNYDETEKEPTVLPSRFQYLQSVTHVRWQTGGYIYIRIISNSSPVRSRGTLRYFTLAKLMSARSMQRIRELSIVL